MEQPKNASERDKRNTGSLMCQHSPTRKRNGRGGTTQKAAGEGKWARPGNTWTSCSSCSHPLRTSQWQLQAFSVRAHSCVMSALCVHPCCLPRWRTRWREGEQEARRRRLGGLPLKLWVLGVGGKGEGGLSFELAASGAARLDGRSRVDLAVARSQVCLCCWGAHAVLDLGRHCHECLFHVCGILGTRL